jgi:hypothetical protein
MSEMNDDFERDLELIRRGLALRLLVSEGLASGEEIAKKPEAAPRPYERGARIIPWLLCSWLTQRA